MDLGKVLGRFIVAVVSLERSGNDSIVRYLMDRKGRMARVDNEDKKMPVVLLFRGDGVIRKELEFSDDRLRKIRENGEFIYEQEEQAERVVVTCVRKERVKEWIEIYGRKKSRLAAIRVGVGEDEAEAERCAALFFHQPVTAGGVAKDDLLAGWIADRLKIPVLLVALGVLAANYWASGYLTSREKLLRSRISLQQKSRQAQEDMSAQARKLSDEFQRAGGYDYCRVLDEIACRVPETMLLSRLEIIPLLKPPEPGKELSLREGYVVIEGTTEVATEVSAFLTGLTGEGLFRQVKLLLLEQDKRNGHFAFKMELQL